MYKGFHTTQKKKRKKKLEETLMASKKGREVSIINAHQEKLMKHVNNLVQHHFQEENIELTLHFDNGIIKVTWSYCNEI
jgi:acyl-ACP thioesterase